MIKPKYKVYVEKDPVLDDGYKITTKDRDVFESLREFGVVGEASKLDPHTRWFFPYGLYDPKDIDELLFSLMNAYDSRLLQIIMDKAKKPPKKTTIESMCIGETGYTRPWAWDGCWLAPQYPVQKEAMGALDMPIKHISEDTWEIDPAKSCYYQKQEVKLCLK